MKLRIYFTDKDNITIKCDAHLVGYPDKKGIDHIVIDHENGMRQSFVPDYVPHIPE